MLHKKTNSKQLWKLLLVLPLITGFIYSCSTETVVKEKENITASLPTEFQEKPTSIFVRPINEEEVIRVNSAYGMRKNPINKTTEKHLGIDLAAPIGTKVVASLNGEITFAAREGGYGKLIIIKHANNLETKYAHLNEIKVSVGDKIIAGASIGTVGLTGKTSGPHLHFEVLKYGKHIDPEIYLGSIKEYHIINRLSDETLRFIENDFNHFHDGVEIKFQDIQRNEDNFLVGLTFSSKFKNQKRFFKNFGTKINNNENELLSFFYNTKEKGIQVEFPNGDSILIKKDGSISRSPEMSVPNPLHIINGKKITQEYLKGKIVSCAGSIKKIAPNEAVEKYGIAAKGGALVYNGKSTIREKSN